MVVQSIEVFNPHNPGHKKAGDPLMDLLYGREVHEGELVRLVGQVPWDRAYGSDCYRLYLYDLGSTWPDLHVYGENQLQTISPAAGSRLALARAGEFRDPDRVFFVLLNGESGRWVFLAKTMELVGLARRVLLERHGAPCP